MKSPLLVSSVTVLVAPLCALAGIVVRASEQARRAKDSRCPRRGTSERARRATSPGGEGRNSLRLGQEGILPVNTERAETRRHGGG